MVSNLKSIFRAEKTASHSRQKYIKKPGSSAQQEYKKTIVYNRQECDMHYLKIITIKIED